MRLKSEQREKIATALAYVFIWIIFVPCWILDEYFPKTWHKIDNWADPRIEAIFQRVEVWINNTPEKTMELLKKIDNEH